MVVISRSLRNRSRYNGGRPGKRSACPSLKSSDECSVNLECTWNSKFSKCRKIPAKRVSRTAAAARKAPRKPISHLLAWDEKKNISPEQRAELAGVKTLSDLNNYDIVENEIDGNYGYRNAGKYIYKDNGLYNLAVHIDDYGHLPDWVEVNKEDCGYSYFDTYLIDHNWLIPFKTNEWKIGKSHVSEEDNELSFNGAYKKIDVITELIRKKDGAKAELIVDIILSAPWLGGPTNTISTENQWDSHSGKSLPGLYSLEDKTSKVVISQNGLKQAESKANSFLKKLFKKTKVINPDCDGPCKFRLGHDEIARILDDFDGYPKYYRSQIAILKK